MGNPKHDSHSPQPDPKEQSGSAGRATPDHATQQRKDTGQGRYGQTGGTPAETQGQEKYRKSERNGDPRSKKDSNEGSGRVEADESAADIPKTG